MDTRWWYFLAGGAVVFAIGAYSLFPRTDSTLYSCSTGDPLPLEMQNADDAENFNGFFSFYSGVLSTDEAVRSCAKREADAMTRMLACTIIAQIDGRDEGDVLEEAWAADVLREEHFGRRADALILFPKLFPPPSYQLRADWNLGDGWSDLSASDVVVYYDFDADEATLGDICFSEWFRGFPLSEP